MDALSKFFKSVWGKSLLILVIWNIALRLVAVAGYFILPERFAPLEFLSTFWKSNFIYWSFANFDGEHYLTIAKYGYQIRSGFPQYAFFPLFPSLIHLVATVLKDYYLASLLVSQFSLYLALVYIAKWSALLKLEDIRLRLLLMTGAVFLASVYTEPLFIALAAMTMYFSEKKWWVSAIFTTILATATRINGIFLVLFLFIKLLISKRNFFKSSLFAFLGLTGIFSYMAYLLSKTGDALAWYHAQGSWGKDTATSPVSTFISYLQATTVAFKPDLVHLVVIFEVVVTLGALCLFYLLIKRKQLDLAYWLYLAGNLAMPILTGSLGSMPRFVLILFPLLVVVPKLSTFGKTLYYISSIIITVTGIILFTRGYWYG